MSGFWNPDDPSGHNYGSGYQPNFQYNNDEMVLNTDQFTFHETNYDSSKGEYEYAQYNQPNQQMPSQPMYTGSFYDPNAHDLPPTMGGNEFDDEPPLLEELGIDPDQIGKKILVVLDPFTSTVPIGDYDLAGPLAFCILLAGFLLLSGGTAHFGYVYSLAMTSCFMMYALLNLMTTSAGFTLTSVASVLGYALLPVVVLSGVGVLFNLQNVYGLVMAAVAVAWSSLAASRLFVTISADRGQRPLIAYPCILLYAVFTLLVIF
ncbi:protein YIPF5 [Macrosteles quadrilineatus]|uniref:protein YIPF5 n=1 Tax=Macrosteles quadrilineatus TaxID=74068 RepID=UPI0023E2BCD9|nr:protein YIPF5 [Macrosteles quadrilineatus]